MAHDACFTASSFGGGYFVPVTPAATAAGEDYFREPPADLLAVIGTPLGWIVEPADVVDLVETLRASGLTVEL